MKKGFSLIEVLLIVALVAVTFAGIMALTQRILQLQNVVRNDFIAEGLLREGAELVKAIRNENVSSSLSFYQDLTPAATLDSTRIFALDWQGINAVAGTRDATHLFNVIAPYYTPARLKYTPGVSYQMTQGGNTPFARYFVAVYKLDGTRPYVQVDVTVYWEERGRGHTTHLRVKLYDQ
ncbi:MAG: hypothetical protein WCO55_04125 [Candidatus Falkowbacteria bacterium]